MIRAAVRRRCRVCLPKVGGRRAPGGLTGACRVNEPNIANRAQRYREHAEEIRLAAREVKHPESRAAMLRIADTYERLAARIEADRRSA